RQSHPFRAQRHVDLRLARARAPAHQGRADRSATALEQGTPGSRVQKPPPRNLPRGQAHHPQGRGQAVTFVFPPSLTIRNLSVYRLMLLTGLLLLAILPVSAGRDRPGRPPQPAATPAASLRPLKDFKVELLYSVPKDVEG